MKCILAFLLLSVNVVFAQDHFLKGLNYFGVEGNPIKTNNEYFSFSFPYQFMNNSSVVCNKYIDKKMHATAPLMFTCGLLTKTKYFYTKWCFSLSVNQYAGKIGGGWNAFSKYFGFHVGATCGLHNVTQHLDDIKTYGKAVKIGSTVFEPTFTYTYLDKDSNEVHETVKSEKIDMDYYQTFGTLSPEIGFEIKTSKKSALRFNFIYNFIARFNRGIDFSQMGYTDNGKEVSGPGASYTVNDLLFDKNDNFKEDPGYKKSGFTFGVEWNCTIFEQ